MPARSIPQNEIEPGISRCLSKVEGLLGDAERLTGSSPSQQTLQNAAILVTFAVEELGKAIVFRKRLQEQSSPSTITVEAKVFEGRGAHDFKQAEAFALI